MLAYFFHTFIPKLSNTGQQFIADQPIIRRYKSTHKPILPLRKINLDVTNNVVTLRGTVETAEQKTEAEHVANNTECVKSVNNQMKAGSATARAPEKKS